MTQPGIDYPVYNPSKGVGWEMDTANEVGTLEQCLFSTGQRVLIAQMLLKHGYDYLLPTVLEDLFTGVQMILDNYCIVKDMDSIKEG
jgi:hypothetical protein